jgi:hypothetical protein
MPQGMLETGHSCEVYSKQALERLLGLDYFA